jgi:carbon storage regulator CsrA
MLVLSRIAGESVLVGKQCEIEIAVLAVRPDIVELRAAYRANRSRISSEIRSGDFARDQVLDLGDGITCAVVDIRWDKARLGITVPKDVMVHRREVWEAISRERRGDDPDNGLSGGPVPGV